MDYDPSQISYEELLKVFWDSHEPQSRAWSRQYMSAVFVHNDEQQRVALETKEREAVRRNGEIFTEIIPASEFYLAEDYHQKYWLRQKRDLLKELSTIYPGNRELVDSTAAARINGYLAKHGTSEALREESNDPGLSPALRKKLLEILSEFDH